MTSDPVFSPKGWESSAQGNLGSRAEEDYQPEGLGQAS
jgi:hypothetical protein